MVSRAVLLIGAITHARKEWEALASKLKLEVSEPRLGGISRRTVSDGLLTAMVVKVYAEGGSREDFLKKVKRGEYDDVVAIYRSNESTTITGPFDNELVSSLPASIKYICHNGAGYDNIDVGACNERNIAVSSTPIAVNDATADMAMFLILGALRQVHIPLKALREKKWRGATPLGHDPRSKTLGILGMGGIGSALAHRARAFGMKIQYHNRSPLPTGKAGDAKYVSFDELLSTSDVLSLNLALNPSTKHIISSPEFAKMKDGVIIVNTARGALINEKALVNALKDGKVWSAGLDVFEREPEIEKELVDNERVVLSPHIGTATWETQRDMELLVLHNLESAVDKGELITQIPEQKNKGSKM